MWPAELMPQARSFYRQATIERVLKLPAGWSVSPKFHFGITYGAGVCHATTTKPVAEYLQYWLNHIGDVRRMDRDWGPYWHDWVKEKIATPEDRAEFDRYFRNIRFADPRPAVPCEFNWPLDKAERLDDARGQLKNAVRERINQVLDAVGEARVNPE